MTQTELNWTELGKILRDSALDAHDMQLPNVADAYSFLRENPECFGFEDWPSDMPSEPNIELIAAYYAAAAEGSN